MSFADKSASRAGGLPATLFLFSSDATSEYQLETQLRGVTIIPGTTEFGYATTKVTKDEDGDNLAPENWLSNNAGTDMIVSTEQLLERTPNLSHVSLVIAWHGTDLRIGNCQVVPKVDRAEKDTGANQWRVANITRSTAQVVSNIDGEPILGGAPADWSIYEAIVYLKSKGLKVTLYPFIMMDVPAWNTLPDPYSDNAAAVGQSVFPWRGRITCSPAAGYAGTVDQTAAAATQVNTFFGSAAPSHFAFNSTTKVLTYTGPNEWSFRRFILHMATIANAAGADDFLIGSEMIGMTSIRSNRTTFPAVPLLRTLAADCRSILGAGVTISYGADWSEYHSYRPSDGTNDIHYNLDPLWSDTNIDYVGIDNYLPITDWREGDDHLDAKEGWSSIYDYGYLKSRMEGGEYYDWYYASWEDRVAQVRTPIVDSAYGKDWVYRQKDFRSWWANSHVNRISGAETTASAWVPNSKSIVFTELGCSAVDKGPNQPNLFVDTKSSESGFPYFSTQYRDVLIQRAFLESYLSYWSEHNETVGGIQLLNLDQSCIWTWDCRPYPAFPKRADFWSDSSSWELGHWLNGRLNIPGEVIGKSPNYAYTDSETPITLHGITYEPMPIYHGQMKSSGGAERATLEVRMPRTADIANLWQGYPPATPITLIVRQMHLSDTEREALVAWSGRVLSCNREDDEAVMSCESIASSLRRPGMTRTYQETCPHALYGSACRANKAAASRSATVVQIEDQAVTLASGWNGATDQTAFLQGVIEWTNDLGLREVRRIIAVDGNTLSIRGFLRDLQVGATVTAILGCNRMKSDCKNLHNNIYNFGGFTDIPVDNPMGSGINNFW